MHNYLTENLRLSVVDMSTDHRANLKNKFIFTLKSISGCFFNVKQEKQTFDNIVKVLYNGKKTNKEVVLCKKIN